MTTINLAVHTENLLDTAGYRVPAVSDTDVLDVLRTALAHYAGQQEMKAEDTLDDEYGYGSDAAQFARQHARTATIARAILNALN